MASSRRTATNENVSTYGGGARDYTSLAAWEADTDIDLVTAAQSEVLECYEDSTSFDDRVTLNGASTNSNYFRIIRPARGQGHDGTPNRGVAFFNTSPDDTIKIEEKYSTAHDLIIKGTITSINTYSGIGLLNDYASAVGCIVFDCTNSGSGGHRGIAGYSNLFGTGNPCYVVNCLSHNNNLEGYILWSGTMTLYNSTATDNCSNGIYTRGESGAGVAKNCCSSGHYNDWAYDGADWTKETCTSEGALPTYVDSANDDFHLAVGDTVCRGNGTDLSSDANFAFDDDIDGNTRSPAWDIGFHEATVDISIAPSVQFVNSFTSSPVIEFGATLAPSAQVATAAVQSPAVRIHQSVALAVQSTVISIPETSVHGSTTVTPSALTMSSSLPTPALQTGICLGQSVWTISAFAPAPAIAFDVIISNSLALNITAQQPFVVVPLSPSEARGRQRLEPVWLVEVVLKNSGPTLYLADRKITVGGQEYEAHIDNLSGTGDRLSTKFLNDRFLSYGHLVEIGDAYPFEGAEVLVKEVYLDDNSMPSSAVTVLKGRLSGPRDIDLRSFSCDVSSPEAVRDRTWRQPMIDTANWPNAYEDLGETEPFIYGSGITVPSLRVDWGASTTLTAEMNATSTILELSDASRFPLSDFHIWVDEENIHVTSRSGNLCTGLTRGADGTQATAHRAGADVVEARAQYDSLLACHELYSVGDIFAEIRGRLWRVTSGVSAVYENGKHLLRATEHIRVKAFEDAVNVADDISIDQPGSNKKVYPNGTQDLFGDADNDGYCYDGNEATATTLNKDGDQASRSFSVKFPSTDYGPINTQYVHARTLGEVNIGGGFTPSTVDANTAGWFRFQKPGGNWDDDFVISNTNPGESPLLYEVYKEVDYTGTTNKSGSAYRSGDIVATHTVERFHAVVSGAKDPDGNYGGAGSLIERPDRAIKHFLVEMMGFSLDDIDIGSFDSAGAQHASSGYKFVFMVGERIVPSEFLKKMAQECRSLLVNVKGLWRLQYMPDSAPEAVKTISHGELAGEYAKFRFSRTPLSELSNEVTARYRRNYSRLRGDSAWNATASTSDSASQDKYGVYPRDVDFGLIHDEAMASHVLSHMLTRMKESRLSVEFPVFWEHFDLKPGDTIEIESPVYNGRKFLIESVRRIDKFSAEVRAREW